MTAIENHLAEAENMKALREAYAPFILAADYSDVTFRTADEVMDLGMKIVGSVAEQVHKKFWANPTPDAHGFYVIEPQAYLDAVLAMTAEQKSALRAGINFRSWQ